MLNQFFPFFFLSSFDIKKKKEQKECIKRKLSARIFKNFWFTYHIISKAAWPWRLTCLVLDAV